MAQRTARLQVPIDQEVLDQLHVMANDLGFDSTPAMIRFWAKGEIKLRAQKTDFHDSNAVVLRFVELILAMKPEPMNAERALSYLLKTLQQVKFRHFFRDLPLGSTSDRIFET